jgi:hypothetical protein
MSHLIDTTKYFAVFSDEDNFIIKRLSKVKPTLWDTLLADIEDLSICIACSIFEHYDLDCSLMGHPITGEAAFVRAPYELISNAEKYAQGLENKHKQIKIEHALHKINDKLYLEYKIIDQGEGFTAKNGEPGYYHVFNCYPETLWGKDDENKDGKIIASYHALNGKPKNIPSEGKGLFWILSNSDYVDFDEKGNYFRVGFKIN